MSALARLALRALGATAPMTGADAAAIRPRLPARFAPEVGGEPPVEAAEQAPSATPDREAPPAQRIHVPAPPVAATPPAPIAVTPRVDSSMPLVPRAPALPAIPAAPFATIAAPSVQPPPAMMPAPAAAPPAPLVAGVEVPREAPADAVRRTIVPAPREAPPTPLQAEVHDLPAPALVPRLPAAMPTIPAPAAVPEMPPDIVIHIGRIDVAAPTAPVRSPAPAPAPRRSGLGDYLRGREPRP